MRFILLVTMTVLLSSAARAQFELPNQPKGILSIPNDKYLRNNTKLLDSKDYPINPNYKSSKTVDEPTKSEWKEKEQVVDPKLLKMDDGIDRERYKVFQKDQDLGDISTTSGSVKISYRDHQYVDGDMIRIYVNNVVTLPRVILRADFQSFDFKLQEGFNIIDFEALNDGSSPPNTAEFKIHDDTGKLLYTKEWNIAAGFKASLLIVKK